MGYISILFMINGILFFALAAIWKKDSIPNTIMKVAFVAMTFANMAGMALAIKAGV